MNVVGTRALRIPAGVLAGTLATMTMDLAMVAAAASAVVPSARTASAPTSSAAGPTACRAVGGDTLIS